MGKSFLLELGNYSGWEKKNPKIPKLWRVDGSSLKRSFFIHVSDGMIQACAATGISSPQPETTGAGHADVLSGGGDIGPVNY